MIRPGMLTGVILVACASGLQAASPKMTPVTPLPKAPANTWVRITGLQTGARRNSAFFYSDAIERFVVAQGLGHEKKVVRPYDVQTLDLSKTQWLNHFPPGSDGAWGGPTGAAEAAGFPHSVNYWGFKDKAGIVRPPGRLGCENGFAVAPGGEGFYLYCRGPRRLVGIKPGCLWFYDVKTRTWRQIAPEHEIDTPAFKPPPELIGAALVHEPVNNELLLLGGQAPNVAGASAGNWSFSLESKSWSRLPEPEASDEWPDRARRLADATGRARSLYYLDLPVHQKVERVNKEVLRDVNDVLGELCNYVALMGAKRPGARDGATVRRASRAIRLLEPHAEALAGGKLGGDTLAALTRAGWELEAVARLVSPVPVPRANPAVCYDPSSKVVVLFGGDRFDGMLNDTWIYDPSDRSWTQGFPDVAPPPRAGGALLYLPRAKRIALVGGEKINERFIYFSGRVEAGPADVWLYDVKADRWELAVAPTGRIGFNMPNAAGLAAAGPDNTIIALSNPQGWPHHADGGTWAVRLDASKVDAGAAAKLGRPADDFLSRAITWDKDTKHFVYDPAWYDQAEPGERPAVAASLAGLPANTWVEVPRAARHVPMSEWGTAVYDGDRDRIYYWTGGHMADPANGLHTYHPALNRWSIPFVPEIPLAKGRTFQDRPDCKNHTYHNYAYDPVTRKVVAATYGGTGVFDPDTGRWTMSTEQPFRTSHYTMNLFTTPEGILVWAEGFFGTFNAETMEYTAVNVNGDLPGYLGPDRNGACWDSRRKVMWLFATRGWKEADGQVWKLDVNGWNVEAMHPANMETIGKATFYLREMVYLPEADLVLSKAFHGRGESARQVAWDPVANRWMLTNIQPSGRVEGPVAMVRGAKRGLLWCMSGGRQTYVLRVDPNTLK